MTVRRILAWFALTPKELREWWACLLAGCALVVILVESATLTDGGGMWIAAILAVGAFGFIIAPYWPLQRVIRRPIPWQYITALSEARAALCALRETAYDHWALASTRHVKDHPFRPNTTAIVLYEPGHGIIGLAVGGAAFMLKEPVALPAGLKAPRPVSYPHVEDTRKLRAILRMAT